MKKGLVIGKFMPLHKGHMKLIDYALNNCDTLTILVCGNKNDSIDSQLRFKWVCDIYEKNKNVRVEYMENNLPCDKKFTDEDILEWCKYIKSRFPNINMFFSSEKYGDYLAKFMSIEHIIYDMNRDEIPISGTMIRNNPIKYLDYLPDVVKSYFKKK